MADPMNSAVDMSESKYSPTSKSYLGVEDLSRMFHGETSATSTPYLSVDDLYQMFHGKPLSENLLDLRRTTCSPTAGARGRKGERNKSRKSKPSATTRRANKAPRKEKPNDIAPEKEPPRQRAAPKQQSLLSPFESFPTEIRIMILRQMDSLRRLHNLILASPTYHATYRTARAEILTQVTCKSRWPSLILDPAPCAFAEVELSGDRDTVEAIIKTARKQYRETSKLEVDQCIALLTIKVRDYVPWRIEKSMWSDDLKASCERLGIYERSKMGFCHVYFEDECALTKGEVYRLWRDAVSADCQFLAMREREVAMARWPRFFR